MKIYGTVRKINDDYYEVPYTEYRDGRKVGIGTEDFDRIRYYRYVKRYIIRVWDGVSRYKSGNRVYEETNYDIETNGMPKDLKPLFAHLGADVRFIRRH